MPYPEVPRHMQGLLHQAARGAPAHVSISGFRAHPRQDPPMSRVPSHDRGTFPSDWSDGLAAAPEGADAEVSGSWHATGQWRDRRKSRK